MDRPGLLARVILRLIIVAAAAAMPGCFGAGGMTLEESGLPITKEFVRLSLKDGSREQSVAVYRAGEPTAARVIFVHGTPGSAGAWTRYLLRPIDGFEMVALDRPGFGESTPRRAVSSLADQASAVEALLGDAGAGGKAILVGHSLGGPIVARVAAENPERVGAIVIIAGSLDPGLERVHPAQYFGNVFPVSSLLPSHLRVANRELIPLKRELRELEAMLGRVTCPVVIVHATDDSLVPYANVAFMVERMGSAAAMEVMTLEAGDHFLPWNSEATVREAIERAAGLAASRASSAEPGF